MTMLLGLACFGAVPAAAQDRLEAQSAQLIIRVDGEVKTSAWGLDASINPDIFGTEVAPGERREVCYISGDQSLCRTVALGEQSDFVVVHEGVEYHQRIVATSPAAVFDAAYQAQHRGTTQVLIPEVYELVNIAIALTPYAQQHPNLVIKTTPYYADLMAHFAEYADHPLVTALQGELTRDQLKYFRLKMNGYAFEYDDNGAIVRSQIYDRTGFDGDAQNDLLPYHSLLQSFSDDTGFRAFYGAHRSLYEEQIAFYEREFNVQEALRWLEGNFPAVEPYGSVKIVFSPLVGANQSLTTFSSNGFTELQPHVNFPYPGNVTLNLTARSSALRRGAILFTEMNHGFINPTAEPYAGEIADAFSERRIWASPGPSDGYQGPQSLFLEMMNWGLISLYYTDLADTADRDQLIERLGPNMERRGFPQFPAFNRFLVDLYRNRPPGTTIADLYPQIIAWCAKHQQSLMTAPTG